MAEQNPNARPDEQTPEQDALEKSLEELSLDELLASVKDDLARVDAMMDGPGDAAQPEQPDAPAPDTPDAAEEAPKPGMQPLFEPKIPEEYADLTVDQETQPESQEPEKKRPRLPSGIRVLLYVCCVLAVAVLLAVAVWRCADDVLSLTKEDAEVTVSIPDGAVNIRLDGQKEFRQNSEHIQIVSKTDKDGIDIRIAPFTKSENVHIPVILSKSGFHDLVYNDFFVGEGADVTIVAGCGIHNCGDCDSEHDGIHTFYIGKNAKVHYIEKHYGEGDGSGKRILNPQTIVYLEEGASIVMDTSQIGGVDDTKRYTKCEANGANSEVQINEKLLTAGDQHAVSEMDVILNGEGSRTRVVSRSVAKEASTQIFYPRVQGNAPCFGHVSCDSIIMGAAKVRSIPEISCNHVDAALMHEAAIGKIAGEQLLKLETLGLTPEEAEEKILEGFLR